MIKPTATTDEILSEIGCRFQRYRVQQNRTRSHVGLDVISAASTNEIVLVDKISIPEAGNKRTEPILLKGVPQTALRAALAGYLRDLE